MAKKKTSSSSANKPARKLVSQRAAASELGITTRWLREWQTADWFPADGKVGTKYDVAVIEAAHASFKRKRKPSDEESKKLRKEELQHDVRLKAAKASKAEREEAIESGQAIERAEVELFLSELCTTVRDRICDFPHDLANSVPNDLHKRVEKAIVKAVPAKYASAVRKLIARLIPQNLQAQLIEEGEKKARDLLREIKLRMDEVINADFEDGD